MTWGSQIQQLEALQSTGVNVKSLENRPVLYPYLQEIFNAFQVLSSTRTTGISSFNTISLGEIKSYIDLFGKPNLPINIFIQLIYVLDAVWLKRHNKEK